MKFNLRNVRPATWVRIIALFLVLVNQIAVSVLDTTLLPFTDAEIYEGVSTVVTLVVSVWSAWKNNSLTEPAQEADRVLKAKKGG
ncbi:phage holin [Bacillus licheniformis]|uniref:phage holin n=1 Tax=Bacillus licheniformis TaxID=1402 RepID=UPI0012FC9182|nr:phage holin [Bacillus licheniformis]MED0689969.1 phage holin [Bacillus licheniformis]MED0713573.1 phage holin [Bacillus licheniformis]MED0789310.1 phage holin [Bacillus licheniformis]TWM10441.1 hypothetical protein CHCC15091_0938 [Bacillus licheniformis]WIW99393.1 phage holin [Bacillus licheniformis]